jgi:5-methyltetrahydrofolate--homocysteine methyltransferase
MDTLRELSESLQRGDIDNARTLTGRAINEKLEPTRILDEGLIAGMVVVGQRFKAHEIFLPDVLLAAKAMYAGMDLLRPLFLKDSMPSLGKVVIGTVQGDLHDIGKNLVAIMLKGAGFEVIDLGKDVAPETFVDTAEQEKAAVIGMSALLTTTMPVMKKVIDLAKERGIYGVTKVVVGGAPMSAEYAREIGAHAYCFDSVSAVDRVKEIVAAK